MPRRHRLYTLLSLALIAGGCASMSAEECELSDWYTIGFEDGAQGRTADAIGERRRACAKHGFSVDFAAYQDGRAGGLVEFCQPQRGFNVGQSGQRYQGVCPADLEPAFLDAYSVGAEWYRLSSEVNAVNAQIDAHVRERERLKEDIAEAAVLVIADDTPKEERVRLVAELANMNNRVGEINVRMDELVELRVLRERALYDYEMDMTTFF